MEISIKVVQAGMILFLLVGLILALHDRRKVRKFGEAWEEYGRGAMVQIDKLMELVKAVNAANTVLTAANDDMRDTLAQQAARIHILQQELEELGTQRQAPLPPLPDHGWDPIPVPLAPPVDDDHAIDLDKFEDKSDELLGHVPIAKED